MKIKTNCLKDKALDWAVAKALGALGIRLHTHIGTDPGPPVWVIDWENGWEYLGNYTPSTDWAEGGPILSEARISRTIDHSGLWIAYWTDGYGEGDDANKWMQCDRSELVAGLRCYVASKLGDEVDIPEGLL